MSEQVWKPDPGDDVLMPDRKTFKKIVEHEDTYYDHENNQWQVMLEGGTDPVWISSDRWGNWELNDT